MRWELGWVLSVPIWHTDSISSTSTSFPWWNRCPAQIPRSPHDWSQLGFSNDRWNLRLFFFFYYFFSHKMSGDFLESQRKAWSGSSWKLSGRRWVGSFPEAVAKQRCICCKAWARQDAQGWEIIPTFLGKVLAVRNAWFQVHAVKSCAGASQEETRKN